MLLVNILICAFIVTFIWIISSSNTEASIPLNGFGHYPVYSKNSSSQMTTMKEVIEGKKKCHNSQNAPRRNDKKFTELLHIPATVESTEFLRNLVDNPKSNLANLISSAPVLKKISRNLQTNKKSSINQPNFTRDFKNEK